MKKLLGLLIFLFAIYFGIQFAFKLFDEGHQVTYSIQDTTIKEVFTQNKKGETNSYFLELNTPSNVFYLQTYQSFGKAERIVTDLKTWREDGYECIYPVTRGEKQISDVVCKKEGITSHYDHMRGKNASLDLFVSSLKEVGYQASNYENSTTPSSDGSFTYYPDHYQKGHYVALENYRGIASFSKENLILYATESLFEKDIYKRPLSMFTGPYYVTANYEEEYQFHSFLVINIKTGEKFTLKSKENLSFDAYFQGTIGSCVYFYDRETKKQYELDLKKKTLIEIGNPELGIQVYENGSFQVHDAYEAYQKTLKFDAYSVSPNWNGTTYARIDKVGKEKTGYYYWYVKTNDQYDVYRSNIASKEDRVYLFSTSRIDQIHYVADYVYYLDGNEVRIYHDLYGVKTIVVDSELTFNPDLKFGAFEK